VARFRIESVSLGLWTLLQVLYLSRELCQAGEQQMPANAFGVDQAPSK